MEININAERILTPDEKAKIEAFGMGEPYPDWEEGEDTAEGIENDWSGYGVYFVGDAMTGDGPTEADINQVHELAGILTSMGLGWSIEGNGGWADSEATKTEAFKKGLTQNQ